MQRASQEVVNVAQRHSDVVPYRSKRPMPAKLPRTGVVRDWLKGLQVQEIFALAQADGWSIKHHI
jgi:hypothetical protein